MPRKIRPTKEQKMKTKTSAGKMKKIELWLKAMEVPCLGNSSIQIIKQLSNKNFGQLNQQEDYLSK